MILGPGMKERLQAKKVQQKALAEDPTIFQYDELYDDMKDEREAAKKANVSSDKLKPRYIGKLLETAEKRKKEEERRKERLVQKEREAEGEMYKDKESFVTSAYREKLEEMRKAEEEEKRQEYLESIGDVTKQKDLGGFYRHIYEQKLGSKKPIQPEPEASENQNTPSKKENQSKSKNYRKRKSSQDYDDDNEENTTSNPLQKKVHIQSNLDADSDFSIDSSSESEDEEVKNDTTVDSECPNKKDSPIKATENTANLDDSNSNKMEENSVPDSEEQIVDEIEVKKPVKEKIDIWKKRTVGEVFDAALQRYYLRKSQREAACA